MIWTLLVISYVGGPWDGYSSTIPFPSMQACADAIPRVEQMLGPYLDGNITCVPVGAAPREANE
jgi:hypothetical protein